jgi:hypothetical protein
MDAMLLTLFLLSLLEKQVLETMVNVSWHFCVDAVNICKRIMITTYWHILSIYLNFTEKCDFTFIGAQSKKTYNGWVWVERQHSLELVPPKFFPFCPYSPPTSSPYVTSYPPTLCYLLPTYPLLLPNITPLLLIFPSSLSL